MLPDESGSSWLLGGLWLTQLPPEALDGVSDNRLNGRLALRLGQQGEVFAPHFYLSGYQPPGVEVLPNRTPRDVDPHGTVGILPCGDINAIEHLDDAYNVGCGIDSVAPDHFIDNS